MLLVLSKVNASESIFLNGGTQISKFQKILKIEKFNNFVVSRYPFFGKLKLLYSIMTKTKTPRVFQAFYSH